MNLISEIDFSLPGALPPTVTKEYRTAPTSGSAATYTSGGVIQFSIPSMPRTFFENNTSYLTGRTTFTGGSANTAGTDFKYFTSGGAYSQFSKFALRSAAGQAIDNIDNPGYLCGMMFSIGMSTGQKISCANTMLTSNVLSTVNVGMKFNSAVSGTGLVIDWAIPMIGVWNSSKYFPAWGNELILELTVNSLTNFVLNGTATANTALTAFSISNLEFVSQVLEFSPESFAQMQAMYGSIIQVKSETYSFGSAPALGASYGAGQIDIPFNIRVKSLKRVLAICSPSDVSEGVGYGSVNPNLDYYQFMSNNTPYPQRGIQAKKPAEVFSQMLRAFGSMYSSDKSTTIPITNFRKASTAYVTNVYTAYNNTTTTAGYDTANQHQFYMVIDLESLSNGKEGLYNGINTTGSTANYIRLNIDTALAAVTHYIYFFSCHDAILTFDFVNGITSVTI